jgi:hypothetical protein
MGTEVLFELEVAYPPRFRKAGEVRSEDRSEPAPQVVGHPRGVLQREIQPRDLAVRGEENRLLAGAIARQMGSKLAAAGPSLLTIAHMEPKRDRHIGATSGSA